MFSVINLFYETHFKTGLSFHFRPVTYAWEGGVALSKTDVFVNKMCVTKAEYDEHGENICKEKFDS